MATSSPAPAPGPSSRVTVARLDERIKRVEDETKNIAKMQEELERALNKIAELDRTVEEHRRTTVSVTDFLGIRSQVGRHETDLADLLQNRNTQVPSSLSRDSSNNETRFPVPVFSGKRSELGDFLKLFETWCLSQGCEKALSADESVKMVGVERAELENNHDRNLIQQSMSAWSGLVKALERDAALLNMVIDARSVPGAWKYLLKLANVGSSDAAYDRAKKSLERLKMLENETSGSYFLRVQRIVNDLEENKVPITQREINRRVVCGLSPRFLNEKRRFIGDPEFKLEDLEACLARVEEALEEDEEGADGNHALAAGLKPRFGDGQRGRGGGGRWGRGGRGGGNRGRRDGRGRPPRSSSSINNNSISK